MDIPVVFIAILAVITATIIITIYHCIDQQRPDGRQLQGQDRGPDTGDTGERVGFSTTQPMPPARTYIKGEGVVSEDQITCAVCLSDFKDGEAVRLLPECLHCFHVQCIDMWLSSHGSCPMCRTATVSVSSAVDSSGGRAAVVAAMLPGLTR